MLFISSGNDENCTKNFLDFWYNILQILIKNTHHKNKKHSEKNPVLKNITAPEYKLKVFV